jgi:uncharacterized protein YjbI with pentapeptide repeats
VLKKASFRGASFFKTRIDGADIESADFRGVSLLNCERFTKAKNWQLALRDESLTCGGVPADKIEDNEEHN